MLAQIYFERQAVIQVGTLFENALNKLTPRPDFTPIMDLMSANCIDPIYDLKRDDKPIVAPRLFKSETSFEAGNIFQMKPDKQQLLKFCIFEIWRGKPSCGILAHFPPAKAENQADCRTSKDMRSKGLSYESLKKLH